MIKKIYLLILVMLFATPGLLAQTPTVTIGDKVADPGEILVPIYMENFEDVAAIQLEIDIDTDILEYLSVTNVATELTESGSVVANYNNNRNVIVITWLLLDIPNGVDLDGKIMDLKLDYGGGFETPLEFVMEDCRIDDATLNEIIGVEYVNGTVGPDGFVGAVSLATKESLIGEEVLMPVTIGGAGFGAVSAFKLVIEIDPDQLDYENVIPAAGVTGIIANETGGIITIEWTGVIPADFTDDTHVLDIELVYKGGGIAPLTFKGTSEVSANLGVLPVEFIDGMVTPVVTDAKITIPHVTVIAEADKVEGLVEVPVMAEKIDADVASIDLIIGFDDELLEFDEFTASQLVGWTVNASINRVNITWSNPAGAAIADGEVLVLKFTYTDYGESEISFKGGSNLTGVDLAFVPVSFVDGSVTISDVIVYPLTLLVSPEGTGTVEGAGDYEEGDVVPITATPADDFRFVNWTDADGAEVSDEASFDFTMPGEATTLTANFTVLLPDPVELDIVNLLDKTGDNLPDVISSARARSAAIFMDRYVVAPVSLAGIEGVYVWDRVNPHLEPFALEYDTEVIEPLTFPIHYVRTAGDAIYVSNLSLNPAGTGWAQGVFQIYRWDGLDASPEIVVSYDAEAGRLGDAFSIIGDPKTNGHIIAHINTTKEFRVWTFEDGVLINEDTPDLITLDIEPAHINNHGIYNAIPGEDDLFLVTSNNMGLMIANLDGDVLAEIPTDVISMHTYDPNIFYYDGIRYLTYAINDPVDLEDAVYKIVDINIGDDVIEAFEAITTSEILDERIVYSKSLGSGSTSFTSNTQVVFNEDGEAIIMAYVVERGFFLETTGDLPTTFALTLEVEPEDAGTVQGAGEYQEGATVPLVATPADDYQFVNWTDAAGNEASDEAEFYFTMPGEAVTLTANFEDIPITEVATLAELRTLAADGTIYMYTGDAVIVAMDGFRNRKFLQDETAAIMIDDNPGVITTEYDLYDVITNVRGRLSVFNDMVQFQPDANTAPATENTPVDPMVFAMDEVTSDDQAKLIRFEGVRFENITEGQVFANGTNYTITDGENTFMVRTDFWNVDYIGEEIPTVPLNLNGVVLQYQANLQLVIRFADDIEELEELFEVTFNVDLTKAIEFDLLAGFDPNVHHILMTGNMFGWAEPGTLPEQTMEKISDDPYIYSLTLHLEAGEYQYKYFSDLIDDGWDGGEWDGDPNRIVDITEDAVINDMFGPDDISVIDIEDITFNLYPVPAQSVLHIQASAPITDIRMIDMLGQVVYTSSVNDHRHEINVSGMKNGVYFVQMITPDGVVTHRVQVTR